MLGEYVKWNIEYLRRDNCCSLIQIGEADGSMIQDYFSIDIPFHILHLH